MATTPAILVVDDDTSSLDALSDELREAGYEVASSSAADARADGVLAVLLDLDLPGGAAFELLGRLRAVSRRLPVVGVTAGRDADLRRRAETHGVVAVLTRPVSPQRITVLLRHVLHDRAPAAASRVGAMATPKPDSPGPPPPVGVQMFCERWDGGIDMVVEDLTTEGLLARTEQTAPVGTKVGMLLSPSDGREMPFLVEGYVVDLAGGAGAGMRIRFGELTPDAAMAMRRIAAPARPVPTAPPPTEAATSSSPRQSRTAASRRTRAATRRSSHPGLGHDAGSLRGLLAELQLAATHQRLELNAGASAPAIRRAFHMRCRSLHPDLFHQDPAAHAVALEIFYLLDQAEGELQRLRSSAASPAARAERERLTPLTRTLIPNAAPGSHAVPSVRIRPLGPNDTPLPSSPGTAALRPPAAVRTSTLVSRPGRARAPHPASGTDDPRRSAQTARQSLAARLAPASAHRPSISPPRARDEAQPPAGRPADPPVPQPPASLRPPRISSAPDRVAIPPTATEQDAAPPDAPTDLTAGRTDVECYEEGRDAIRTGRFRDARNLFSHAAWLDAKDKRYRAALDVARGYLARQEGDEQRANDHFEQALRHDKQCAQSLHALREQDTTTPGDSGALGILSRFFKR